MSTILWIFISYLLENEQPIKIAFLYNFYDKMWVGFYLNKGKRLIVEVSF